MIAGYCPKCCQRYYGTALLLPDNQSCSDCRAGLLITKNGKPFIKGYSAFTNDMNSARNFTEIFSDFPDTEEQ